MAAKTATKTETKNVVDSTTKALEDAATKVQEQYFSVLEQGQSLALEGFETVVDALNKIDMPAVPGLESFTSNLEDMKIPTDAFDGIFDFTLKVIENQREFAHKVLAVGAKA